MYNFVIMSDAETEQILQTLDDLCHLEAAMAAYYLACSEKWESKSSLWMELALEEENHEKIIRIHENEFVGACHLQVLAL